MQKLHMSHSLISPPGPQKALASGTHSLPSLKSGQQAASPALLLLSAKCQAGSIPGIWNPALSPTPCSTSSEPQAHLRAQCLCQEDRGTKKTMRTTYQLSSESSVKTQKLCNPRSTSQCELLRQAHRHAALAGDRWPARAHTQHPSL